MTALRDVDLSAVCELTGLAPFRCAHCLGTVPDDDETPVRTCLLASLTDWVPAEYPGLCVACGMPYSKGAAIASEPGGWRADCCPRS